MSRVERAFTHPERGVPDSLRDGLASSAALAERYRRLQLAERVAAHGPEAALETPSPAEIDRIAAGLGLLEPAPRRLWRWTWAAAPAFALVAAVLLLVVWPRPTPEVVQVRGGAATGASFAAYAVGADGGFTPLADARVTAGTRLKLRLSWAEAPVALDAVWVAVVPASGPVRVTRLAAPAGRLAAVPGVVALRGVPGGPVQVYAIAATARLDEAAVRAAVAGRLPDGEVEGEAEVGSALGAAGVTRWTAVVSEDAVP